MQLIGEIKSISDTQKVSERFQKREFVLTTEANTQYPQHIILELQQDSCDIIDAYQEGQEVTVDFNIKGRQWTDQSGNLKTANTLRVWKIQPLIK